jgi:hypothetical protein
MPHETSLLWFFLRARDRTIAAVESVKEREMMIQAGLLSFDLTKAADVRVASDRGGTGLLCGLENRELKIR